MIGRMGGRWNRALSAIVGLIIAAPFYWLLIDTTSAPELIAGAVAAVIAAAAYSAAHLEPSEDALIRLRWVSMVIRELAQVPLGIWIVCGEVLAQTVAPRSRRGVLEADPFDAGNGSAEDLGRRALAEAFRSFAPHTVALGVDPDHDRLVQHRIGKRR